MLGKYSLCLNPGSTHCQSKDSEVFVIVCFVLACGCVYRLLQPRSTGTILNVDHSHVRSSPAAPQNVHIAGTTSIPFNVGVRTQPLAHEPHHIYQTQSPAQQQHQQLQSPQPTPQQPQPHHQHQHQPRSLILSSPDQQSPHNLFKACALPLVQPFGTASNQPTQQLPYQYPQQAAHPSASVHTSMPSASQSATVGAMSPFTSTPRTASSAGAEASQPAFFAVQSDEIGTNEPRRDLQNLFQQHWSPVGSSQTLSASSMERTHAPPPVDQG